MKPKNIHIPSLLLLFALVFSACTPRAAVRPGDFDSLTAALDAEMPHLLNAYRVPGASIAIVKDGELAWSKGYGLADKENLVPAAPDTVYQIASISKTVAAWGIMRLVEQGKLDLDAPVSQYLTRWQLPPSEFSADGVTIRRLLSHSAGLSVHGYPGYAPDSRLPSLEESLSGATLGPNYAVKIVTEPGTVFSYSGGGYTMLQLIVEEVSGQNFAAFMQQEIFTPLGLNQSSYSWREDLRSRTARPYDTSGNLLPNYLFTELAAAGEYTTAEDLARFGQAHLPGPAGKPAGGGLLTEESLRQMREVVIAIPPNSFEGYISGMDGYGLGCYVETLPDGSRAISHTGGNKGWRSLLIAAPEQQSVLVVLTNSDNGSGIHEEVRARWAEWLGTGTPKGIEHLSTLTNLISAVSVLLLIGFGWWAFRFASAVAYGKRRFQLVPDLRKRAGWRLVLGLLAALFLTALWFFLGLLFVGAIFPLQASLVGAAVMAWVLALALSTASARVL